eukprot:CAMPEP_0206448432 /NCGR_PEP_ID=MMETSP0324_2-20121206/17471_1 /ASSEMBLY_ACC=CAM_ASM_000836 /TAXON_ID=2866 /ORGANISM="Crypthecodinium cohnii, Strain Seligo" /LENGTH=63 /DNA_ID=CAMNT_0053917579 /DNA_START=73 /DNA_END=261 /DNA_ORIENTATION=+
MAGVLTQMRRAAPALLRVQAASKAPLLASQTRFIQSSAALRHQAVNPGWPVMYSITYDKPGWD